MPDVPCNATVLAVDDTPDILTYIRLCLQGEGYTIVTAGSRDEALLKLAECNPDLIILDINLGEGKPDGFDVLRFLRGTQDHRRTPVLMLTAYSDVQFKVKGIEGGADEFLTKPVERLELRTRVRGMLRAKFYRQQLQEKNALLERILSVWHSREIVDRVIGDPSLLNLGGERRPVTVLFADLCGFTRFSESVPPEEVVEVLNQTFRRLTGIVLDHRGTIDKYVGDCLMAFFGAPVASDADALNAVRSAVEMRQAFQELRATWGDGARARLGLAIGVNSGEAVVGNIGSERLMGYTVIGDAVNVAARLQDRAEDGQIFLGEATYNLVSRLAVAKRCEEVQLKGRAQPMAIYELVRLFQAA